MHFSTTRSGRYRYAAYQRRLTVATTLSLLVHAFILSLQFGLPGLGLPGLELPWNQRRPQPVALSVALSNAKRASEPVSPAETARHPAEIVPDTPVERAHSSESIETPSEAAHPARANVQLAPTETPNRQPERAVFDAGSVIEKSDSAPAVSSTDNRPRPSTGSGPHVITKDDTGQSTFAVPPSVLDEAGQTMELNASARPKFAEAQPQDTAVPPPEDRSALERKQALAAQKLAEEESARRAREAEANTQEEKRLTQEREARRQAEAMALQARQKREEEENVQRMQELEAKALEDLKRQEEARELSARKQAEEAAQQRTAALALQKQAEQKRLDEENARRARELEARKREELRLHEEADAKRAALEHEARRQAEEAALRRKQAEEFVAKERADAEARRQAEAVARQREQALAEKGRAAEAAGIARNALGSGLASRALEQARKPGDLPAAPPTPHQPPLGADPARRRSILGRVDQDVGLMMYVESWRLKIERNGRLNYKQSLVDTAYTEPIVTVAVRSDGSIEDILFHRSSGRPELDEAVRRIVRLNARYAAFPPEMARRYDVIEIRRVWNFDDKLRLLDEVR